MTKKHEKAKNRLRRVACAMLGFTISLAVLTIAACIIVK